MAESKATVSEQNGSTYDDVFRTLVTDCSSLVIPLINEAFGEHYTGNERIIFRPNEHYLRQQDGKEQERITDSSFRIVGKDQDKSYLFECQSTNDNSMLVRIFEYATQIALDHGTLEGNKLIVEIPNAAVLYLRSTGSTPDQPQIEMRTPGGTVSFDVPVLKVKSYTIDDIFQKKLYFLIPYYIFVHESRFKDIDASESQLQALQAEYIHILDRLDLAMNNGDITAFTRKTLVEMANNVLCKIAEKYSNVKEGVKNIMGGRVLQYEAKDILNQGISQGLQRGRIGQAIEDYREIQMDDSSIIKKLMQKFSLATQDAISWLQRYDKGELA